MPSNHQETTHGGYSGAGFEAISYDVDAIEPDAYPGEYTAKIVGAEAKLTRETSKPMIVLEWKLTATESDDENCQKSLEGTINDYLVLAADKKGNQGKVKLRTLRDTLELDPDVIPSTITSFEDLKTLMRALKGKEMTVWITNRTDSEGNVRTNIQYTAPRGSSTMGAMASPEDDEEPEERLAPKTKAPAKTPAKSNGKGKK